MAALSKWVPIGAAPDQSETIMLAPVKQTAIDKIGGILCHICQNTFLNKKDYDSHYVKHNLGSAEIIYTCVVCHKEIVGYPSFRGHCYLNHVMKDKFECENCNKRFSKLSVLNNHIKTVHQYKCVSCAMKFTNQKELTIHQIIHKNDHGPPYNCGTCAQQIDSTDDCEHHLDNHCLMTYSCPICDETIDNIHNAASHLTKHFGNVLTKDSEDEDEEDESIEVNDSSIDLLGGIYCCHCQQFFKARPEFDNHFVVEHADKPIVYACNICGKEYDKYILFNSHCYDHYSRGRYQCESCFKCFNRLSLLVTHVDAFHGGGGASSEKPFACHSCDHGFKSLSRLRDHQRKEHNIFYHQCPVPECKKIFTTSKELSQHLKEHKETSLYCRTCGLRFRSLAACERHVHVHRKKEYRCPVCDRAYGEKYLAVKHINQHFSSVLHICKICGKVYNARSRLNFHMKVHNEVKEHKCTYCGKGFSKNYLLNQHLNIHTGLRPYICTVCSKSFASQPNLAKHMKCMHKIYKIDWNTCYNPNPVKKITPQSIKLENSDMVEQNCPKISNEESNEIPDNNNTGVYDVKQSPSLEMSVEMYDAPAFEDSDESGWKTEGIDPSVLDMLEENIGSMDAIGASADDIIELENALWAQSPAIPAASPTSFLSGAACAAETACVPREYGPEFVNALPAAGSGAEYIHLDDHLLPHIDPRLTIADTRRAPSPPPIPSRDQRWEPPIFTKVYQDYQYSDLQEARYEVLNTDIF